MALSMRVWKFYKIPKSLTSLLLTKFFSDSDETEEESEVNGEDIDYDQIPITCKFIVIICFNNSSDTFIFWMNMYSNEIYHQKK